MSTPLSRGLIVYVEYRHSNGKTGNSKYYVETVSMDEAKDRINDHYYGEEYDYAIGAPEITTWRFEPIINLLEAQNVG